MRHKMYDPARCPRRKPLLHPCSGDKMAFRTTKETIG